MNKSEDKKNREQEIAKTIFAQIGKNKLFSLQAKTFVSLNEDNKIRGGLQFFIKSYTTKINKVVIKLEYSDTYRVEFWNIKSGKLIFDKISEKEYIYCDQLGEIILDECEILELPTFTVISRKDLEKI